MTPKRPTADLKHSHIALKISAFVHCLAFLYSWSYNTIGIWDHKWKCYSLIHFTSCSFCLMPVSVFFNSTWTAAVWGINPTAAVQPKGGPCFHLKSAGCFFKRARQRGGRTASEGMRSLFRARMNQLFCEHMHKTQVILQLSNKWAFGL